MTLDLSRSHPGPSGSGFNIKSLSDSSSREVRQLNTPFTPYGLVERDAQQEAMFRETMGGIVRQIVYDFALTGVGPLLSICNVHAATNPNELRVVVRTRVYKPGRFRETASFGAPHYLTQRETQAEVTARRFILGAYFESVFTATVDGMARLVNAMRQVGYAWTRTIMAELVRALMESLPMGADILPELMRQSDARERSRMLAQRCLDDADLVAVTRKRLDGFAVLRSAIAKEARARVQPPPGPVFVAEGFEPQPPVTPALAQGANTSEAVAVAALNHNLPTGTYVGVPAVLDDESQKLAFEASVPIGELHPGFCPLWALHNLNPNDMSPQMQTTTFADHATKRWTTVHVRTVLDNCGLFAADGSITRRGIAFFSAPVSRARAGAQNRGGNEDEDEDGGAVAETAAGNATVNDYLAAFGITLEGRLAGGNNLGATPIRSLRKANVLAHVAAGGLLPFGYDVLRNVGTQMGAAIAASGKPVDAIIGQAQVDTTKTSLLEQLVTSVGFLGAAITEQRGVYNAPKVVPIRIKSGASAHESALANLDLPEDVESFKSDRSLGAKTWCIVPCWPGEVGELLQQLVAYPNFRDPATGELQLPSFQTLGLTLSSRTMTVNEVLRGGVKANRPAYYAPSHTLGATLSGIGAPVYTLVRCVDAILGSGDIQADTFANLFRAWA